MLFSSCSRIVNITWSCSCFLIEMFALPWTSPGHIWDTVLSPVRECSTTATSMLVTESSTRPLNFSISRRKIFLSSASFLRRRWRSLLLSVDPYLLCLLLVFSSPARLSVSVVSVLLSIPPSHLHVISVDKRILTLTSLPIVSAILRSHLLTSSLHCTSQ